MKSNSMKSFVVFSINLVLILFLLNGCSEDDPVNPDPPSVGTIVVNPTPDTIDAPWTGDHSFTDMFPGEYTLTWGDVGGYFTPTSETKTLAADSTVVFNGTYLGSGTIVIDQSPDDLIGAGWTLTGPLTETGSGDMTLEDVPIGEYSLTWNSVDGYITPNVTVSGVYIEMMECSITVTTPQAGRSWFTGTQISINWNKTTGGNVMVQLFKGADLAGTITPSTPNSGFYPWLVSRTFGLGTGDDYSVKVIHLDDSSCFGQSGLFELKDGSNCTINFPWTQNDPIPDLVAGNIFEITWTSGHTTGDVDPELSYETLGALGDIVGIIAENLVDSGSYIWTVDSFHRGTHEGYRIKIHDASVPNCNDRSVPFRITDEENCSIDVLGINEGTTYRQGEVLPLSFVFENSSGVVDLRLYTGNEPVTGGLIVENFDTQNGMISYDWIVTDFGHSGQSFTNFNIRAWDSNDGYCVGESSRFTIEQ